MFFGEDSVTSQQNICVGGYPAKGQRGIRTRATKLKSRAELFKAGLR